MKCPTAPSMIDVVSRVLYKIYLMQILLLLLLWYTPLSVLRRCIFIDWHHSASLTQTHQKTRTGLLYSYVVSGASAAGWHALFCTPLIPKTFIRRNSNPPKNSNLAFGFRSVCGQRVCGIRLMNVVEMMVNYKIYVCEHISDDIEIGLQTHQL